MVQIILAGAAAALLALWIRPLKPEYGMFLSLGAMLLLFGACVFQLEIGRASCRERV